MRVRLVALVGVLCATACIGRSSQVCANGVVCPADGSCDPAGGCFIRAQLDACRDRADHEPCNYAGVPIGVCRSGGCVSVGCGNALVEPGEACDDGNVMPGDGCSSDCRSTEACGNGFADRDLGEQCDDGNLVSGDTCQATCQVPLCGDNFVDTGPGEQCDDGAANGDAPNVACRSNCQPRFCGDGFTDTMFHEVCDDKNSDAGDGCTPDCRSLEVCGNGITDYLAAQQELCDDENLASHDGCNSRCLPEAPVWTREALATALPVRKAHGAIYDPVRGELLAFGGTAANVYLRDTWTWDGAGWTNKTPSAGPVARIGPALVHDARRGRPLMFGGDGGGYHDDTWEWTGTAWSRLFPTAHPPECARPGAAYDGRRGRIVLFGGVTAIHPYIYLDHTWEWTGSDWVEKTPAMKPSMRAAPAMWYDPVRDRTMLFGGWLYYQSSSTIPGGYVPGTNVVGDMWEWDGTTWTPLAPAGAPSARGLAAVAYDPVRQRAVLFGGTGANDVPLAETWEWNGTTWTQRTPATSPPARTEHTLVYDSVRGRIVLVGGYGAQDLGDVWEWDGTDWAQRSPSAAPTPGVRRAHAATYDPIRGQVAVFGGFGPTTGTRRADTWVWSGLAWAQAATTGPSSRYASAMAFDALDGAVVLFGGMGASLLDDTWRWNGAAWSQHLPAPSPRPSARAGHGMAYDVARDRIVLFGGQAGARLNDTWEWDGAGWAQKVTTLAPPARKDMGIAYDVARQQIVVFGGSGEPFGDSCRNDTWVWDGATWTDKSSAVAPTSRCYPSLSYDAARRTVVMIGGWNHQDFADAWEWDGAAWRDITPIVVPPGRAGHTTVYDVRRREHVVFGGGTGYPPGSATQADTWTFTFGSSTLDETCTQGYDTDGDGLLGIDDRDCIGASDPLCAAFELCAIAARPRCGDQVCGPLETPRLCPGDCPLVPACGDYLCDANETCPGDCP